MSLVASLSLLIGIVFGLRFNVRLLFSICLMVIAGCLLAALFGSTAPVDAALFAVVTTVAVQVGYFVSMVIGAMHLTDAPETHAPRRSRTKAARHGLEGQRM